MEEARADLVSRHDLKLKLVEAEAAGRTTSLRSKLTEAEWRAKAVAAALVLAQTEFDSARVELLPL